MSHNIQQRGGVTEIELFGPIGFENEDSEVIRAIRDAGKRGEKRIDLLLNSEGGSAFQGFAIANAIRESTVPIHCTVYGYALSAAGTIMLECHYVTMLQGSYCMFHETSAAAMGGIDDLERAIKLMKQLNDETTSRLIAKTGATRETVIEWLKQEKWFSADEALAAGLINSVKPQKAKLAASFDPGKLGYKNMPSQLQEIFSMTTPNEQLATPAEIRGACSGCDDSFVLQQIESKATLSVAQSAWSAIQARELAVLRAQKKSGADGVPVLGSGQPTNGGGSGEDFDTLVRECMARNPNMNRFRAIESMARKHPQAHQQFLLDTNPGKQSQRLIEEKYA
jgi:ATP-dependent protease ClpP protease subunit